MRRKRNILLLGGTQEATEIDAELACRDDVRLITSLAGRTRSPVPLEGELISGGFGGPEGFAHFLRAEDISVVIDASHPYAARISQTAFACCEKEKIDYLRFCRPPWKAEPADRWIAARDTADVAEKIAGFKRIFLTIGRQELAAFEGAEDKFFLVRSIEKGDFVPRKSEVAFLRARGPFSVEDEIALMKEHQIDLLVSKNSGGAATIAKIEAARRLSLPVLMIERPTEPPAQSFSSVEELLAALSE